jgi:ubiquinone/menaquinone biosynthesis C-methylase UbiE
VDADLITLAREVGDDWTGGPYYDAAEAGFQRQWDGIIWPMIQNADFSCTVELAAGHGRNSEKLRHLAKRLYLVDINRSNIEFLKKRFAGADDVTYLQNNGVDLEGIADGEASLVYTFDSMVHFDSDVVRAYLREFARVLRPKGQAFCHYSNYDGNPTGSYRDHPGWRNFMSRNLFEHYAAKEGLVPRISKTLPWTRVQEGESPTDAVTLLQKPR